MNYWDRSVDVIICGLNAGGVVAAITAKLFGFDVLIIESEGTFFEKMEDELWIPNHPIGEKINTGDSFERARDYLHSLYGDDLQENIREAFLEQAPEMLKFLQDKIKHIRIQLLASFPDYYPHKLGGLAEGRTLIVKKNRIRRQLKGVHIPHLNTNVLETVLLLTLTELKVECFHAMEIQGYKIKKGQICGIYGENGEKKLSIEARKGIIFDVEGWSEDFIKEKLNLIERSFSNRLFHGRLEMEWKKKQKRIERLTKSFRRELKELRAIPNYLFVNQQSRRFVNETTLEPNLIRALKENAAGGQMSFFLITDQIGMNEYYSNRRKNTSQTNTMFLQGKTLIELARKLVISEKKLQAAVWKYNYLARTGVDEDFHRGEGGNIPFLNNKKTELKPINHPPFYGAAINPKVEFCYDGFRTDEFARVLNHLEKPIKGLFAVGTFPNYCPDGVEAGLGAFQGFSMTYGYIAAKFLVNSK
ncbi:FAD-binding protein [Cytobacillus sp. Hz8]|uniref:FAD-binding protein n=1 Tax=Cytobacillus sp. Hz8 TaxID=3347168 RepID=UPI0035DBB763